MITPTTAISDISTRRVFAPYFKARWQNLQNIITQSAYFTLIPAPFSVYYYAYIQQWLDWSRGFVPSLHRGDFFTTGMGYTICDIYARECMSGGFRFESENKELQEFMNDWHKGKLSDVFSRMFFFSNSGGNCVLKLTPVNGELTVKALPIDRLVFDINENGDITEAVIYNRFFAGGKQTYFARETRVQHEGEPFYKVELCVGGSTATTPIWSTNTVKEIPLEMKSQWVKSYGDIELGEWYRLPYSFRSLGLYNVRNKSVAVALADLAGYSDSTLHTALDILYSIDYNYTQQQLDMYWGKTRVLVPKEMQPLSFGAVNGTSYTEAIGAPLNEDIFTQVPSGSAIDGKAIQPIFMQPDLRGEMHKYIRDSDLELLASKVGLSSATLANHLQYNSTKTATQVVSEQDTTETSVSDKRALATVAINSMLKDIATFYGYSEAPTITWNKAGVNTSSSNRDLLEDFNAGTIPLAEYLKRRWRDLDDEQIASWVELIKIEAKETAVNNQATILGGMSEL